MILRIFTFILIFISANFLYAHGDLHERIKKVSQEIKNHSDSAYLYLRRGELLFQHEDFKKSIRDFKTCAKLGLMSDRLEFGFAKSFEKMGKLEQSMDHLNQILTKEAKNVKALRIKGRILMKMERYAEAGSSFEEVIKYTDKTITENYLEASLAWEKSQEPEYSEKAINIIKTGILELGELMVFFDRLVELYLKEEDHKSALVYQSKIIEKSNRKERAYYKRALIYLDKGDQISAKSDLESSNQAIKHLPSRIKNNQAIIDLESDVYKLLKTLNNFSN